MGGVAVYLAFAITALLVLPLTAPVVGLLLGGLAAVVVGVLDELLTLRPLVHLGGQAIAVLVAIAGGVGVVRSISIPTATLASPGFALPFLAGAIFTVLWLLGMMNTMNFLDGMDGLAAGVAALAALLLAAWALESHPFLSQALVREDLILPLALAGALFGFLPYNWHPAKIFLGDSGSMFLGLAIGTLAIVGPAKLGTALVVLMIPVLDVAWAIVRRRLRGRSFLSGDRQHVYHRMLELNMSHTSVVSLLYFLVLSLGVLDLVLIKFAKLVAFLLLAITIGSAFVLLEVRANRRAATRGTAHAPEALPPSKDALT